MRVPRRRHEIVWMVAAVSVAGFVFWVVIASRQAEKQAPERVVASNLPMTIAEKRAEASYKQAKLVREVAEYALKEYEEGLYLQAKAEAEGQITPENLDKERAKDRLRWSEGGAEPRSRMPIIPWKNRQQATDFDPRQEFTKDQQIELLRGGVEKARTDEASKWAIYQQVRARTPLP
jgi:hypothetical protein